MASSETQICNLALGKISGYRIESISDADDESARKCSEFYGQARDFVTEAGLWRHAKRTLLLEETTSDRANYYDYAYTRPSDCLKLWYLLPYTGAFDPAWPVRFETEADVIYSDEAQARGVYVRQITDVTKFAPSFTDAVAWYLAHLLVTPLRLENALIGTTLSGYAQSFSHAVSMGAVEQVLIRSAEESMPDWQRGR